MKAARWRRWPGRTGKCGMSEDERRALRRRAARRRGLGSLKRSQATSGG
jgi:hypothetical protein